MCLESINIKLILVFYHIICGIILFKYGILVNLTIAANRFYKSKYIKYINKIQKITFMYKSISSYNKSIVIS